MPVEGFTSRADHFWVFEPILSGAQVAVAPFGCPVRLVPSGLESLKAVTERVGSSRVRDNLSRAAVTNYP